MKYSDIKKIVREELLNAMSEDLISSTARNEIIDKIVKGLDLNEGISKVIKEKKAKNGSIIWVVGKDSKVYEITIRPKLTYTDKDSEIFNDQKQ